MSGSVDKPCDLCGHGPCGGGGHQACQVQRQGHRSLRQCLGGQGGCSAWCVLHATWRPEHALLKRERIESSCSRPGFAQCSRFGFGSSALALEPIPSREQTLSACPRSESAAGDLRGSAEKEVSHRSSSRQRPQDRCVLNVFEPSLHSKGSQCAHADEGAPAYRG